jgi:agmatine/peptidylarginine deiminase
MTMTTDTVRMPAEWAPQWGVQLTWPHADTDWAPYLADITRTYIEMARAIAARERLIIVTPDAERVRLMIEGEVEMGNVVFHECPTDDTWARDHAFLTLSDGTLLDFQFNGWGRKFAAERDNAINRSLAEHHRLPGTYSDQNDFVLEGGSIESDGRGTILTTSQCLLAPNRNQPLSQDEIEERLKLYLHAERVLWLDYGYLAGDDTDSHIDTLCRFCPSDTIAYVQCKDTADEHYAELHRMEEQLTSFRTLEGQPYRLVPLPMAAAVYDADGQRLPATYANFLCINGAVLMPTYGKPERDEQARQQLQTAFPRHEIVPVDCRILIEQHGSLHCCTMQFPTGVIPPVESTNTNTAR